VRARLPDLGNVGLVTVHFNLCTYLEKKKIIHHLRLLNNQLLLHEVCTGIGSFPKSCEEVS
jgi:hypothetical protein